MYSHPFQTSEVSLVNSLPPVNVYDHKFGKIYYVVKRIFGFNLAVCYYPIPSEELLTDFISFIKSKRMFYKILVYDNINLPGARDKTFTQFLDTSNPEFSKGIRCNIKAAEKHGLVFKKLENKEEWDAMALIHSLMSDSKKLNNSFYEYQTHYSTMFELNNKSLHAFGAYLNDKLISAVVVFYNGNYGVYSKSVTLPDCYKYQPTSFLLKNICDYEKDNFRFLDMDLGENVKSFKDVQKLAIVKFKQQFGYDIPVYVYMSKFYSVVKRIFDLVGG